MRQLLLLDERRLDVLLPELLPEPLPLLLDVLLPEPLELLSELLLLLLEELLLGAVHREWIATPFLLHPQYSWPAAQVVLCALRLEARPPEVQAFDPVRWFPHRTVLLELPEPLPELLPEPLPELLPLELLPEPLPELPLPLLEPEPELLPELLPDSPLDPLLELLPELLERLLLGAVCRE